MWLNRKLLREREARIAERETELAEIRRRRTEVRLLAPSKPKVRIGDRMFVTIDEAVEIRDNLNVFLKEMGRG